MDSSKKFNNSSPELSANFLSKLTFCWVVSFLKQAYRKGVHLENIYSTVDDDSSGFLGDVLEKNWNTEIEKCRGSKKTPSLKKVIFITFGKSFSLYGVYGVIEAVLRSIQPVLLAEYIHYFDVSAENRNSRVGWFLATGLIFSSLLVGVLSNHFFVGCQRIGMKVRIACCSLVYRKLLKLDHTSLGGTGAGQLVNLMSNDVQRFDLASMNLNHIWLMPIQGVIGFYVMYRTVGVAAVAGMAAMILESIPMQGYFSKLQGKLRYKIANRTDHRVKLLSEILSGIQVIKMYAWEKSFEKVAELARRLEIDKIKQASYFKVIYLSLTIFTDRLCLYLTLVTFVLLGNRLTGDVVFSMARIFNIVQIYMAIYFPTGLTSYAEAKISIRRLQEFLLLEENKSKKIEQVNNSTKIKNVGGVDFSGATATWSSNAIVSNLIDINLRIKPGTLCCVVGNIGSGKTSLLQAILGELPLTEGQLLVDGKMSYASQEPWLFVSSVKKNILFGQPYVKKRYQEVVRVCALETDFEQFPHGDRTLVEERGVSLSGGQRARINLARAVYSDADIYLFDDPLSAVDTHVGKHLFDECIVNYLEKKTRILVTHQVQFLKKADLIVVLNNGRIEKIGTFDDLDENELKHSDVEDIGENEQNMTKLALKNKSRSIASIASSILTDIAEPEETQELMEKGTIPVSIYTDYYKSGASVPYLIFAMFFLIIAQLSSNAVDYWVAYWTGMEDLRFESTLKYSEDATLLNHTKYPQKLMDLNEVTSNITVTEALNVGTISPNERFIELPVPTQEFFMVIYSLLIVSTIILTPLSRNICYIILIRASKALHNIMFNNILQAPMRFFDTNPSGRILNRFSKDMGIIDEVLPKFILDAAQVFLVMGGILMVLFIFSPLMILPTIILAVIFYWWLVIYLASAQDMKRLEGVTRAPVFSHTSASLYGLRTIRASNAEKMVINEFDSLQDQHTSTWFLCMACSQTFGFYLDVMSVVLLTFVVLQFLIFSDENTLSAYVGLVISQTMILGGMLQLGPRATADVASNMTSVERVLQYTKLDKEGPFETLPAQKPPRSWPERGKITFKNTYLWYVPDESPILKNLNMEILPGEKIGIVGRTGAGKSTLIASLFRLAPIEGSICIDDVDTASVGLRDLRSNISIIPQDPVLFSATIRYNLDPLEKVTDDLLWNALEKVELKHVITSLDMNVSEGGSNFSAGQRQLVCLARAIVRNNKILVMDEATANVDHATDALIQKTIRQNFKDCTVLTIAHRLNTIMDSDRVLVMDAGEAVEYSHPYELLENPEGYFTKMLEELGTDIGQSLRKIAKENYDSRVR